MGKKWLGLCLAVLVAAGCSKAPESVKDPNTEGRKFLIEGTVFLKQSEPVKALQSFASAVKVAPDLFEGYSLLGETLMRLQQFTQAEAVLLAAVKRFPDNGAAYYLLSIAQDGAGNTVPAILAARKSADLFAARGDKENTQRALVTLAALVAKGKQMNEEKSVAEAAKAAELAAGVSSAVIPHAGTPVAQ